MNLTSYLQDQQLMIALTGEIDHHSARQILRTVESKIEQYLPRVCILDFKDVTFMDSSGIAVVIAAVRRMRELQGCVALRQVPPQPKKVFTASGIERIVDLEERKEEHENG